ncbi:MAG: nuclear transport factor 2 family protein [Bacteroidota bacterium]|uniref:nuclear transport factor 2 family protein n=1 Tax=Leeuwenhoekiella palythoae TaxID=573501 RepID=UPI000C48E7B5|nr:nuclear transport factor 2 family protein [Leeuwenhoekiella palythoae]MBH11761.1 3-methyl-2-oxobutanoate hydroxymethyltransferase [Leeuwenhoekiella sp.]MEC7782464.1 nuclear transport factor 2 family protein [Bacteroidota bacterium]MEC8885241.1 nuclear transport factor 2 family protein [Bacteroidota bacterium]UBZ10003.1 nuclear transport factor 2 family protein [Leeuwenhoekiella palythoae]HAX16640.1 3-methyl-2-oxobutanoate hydroxymethyltransferase [Leeuwenhoekiella sp.]
MKRIITLVFIISFSCVKAQEPEQAKEVVIAFFNAFHQQDTLAMKELVYDSIKMQSIGRSKSGSVKLSTSSFDSFLQSIAGIPDTVNFEERILDYKVRVDALMANVWTPYEFYINNEISHCGVNNFQMIWDDNTWKIFYIVDTRHQEGCK